MDSLAVLPAGRVRSPCALDFTTKIGRSGARPLATTNTPSPKIGVGAVIFELPPSRHNSFPVRGSYPRMKFEALVTSTGPVSVVTIVGVPQDGSSSRSVFQTVFPVAAFRASRKESVCVSHCRITRLFQIIGELAGPHSYVGMSYGPRYQPPPATLPTNLTL